MSQNGQAVGQPAVVQGVADPATAVGPGADEQGGLVPPVGAPKAAAGGPPTEPARGATQADGWGYFPPNVSEQERPVLGYMAESMRKEGVPTERGSQFFGWMRELDGAPAPNEQRAHKYDLARFQWSEEDQPYVNAYLNRAAAAGWSQEDVERVVRWYKVNVEPHVLQDRVSADREVQQRDAADSKAAMRALREEWGDAATANFRVLGEYVRNLPQAEREALKQKELPDGRLALNDPATIKALVSKATSGNGMTLAEIREVMAKDRKRYNRDEAMQARYRELLRGQAA